MHVMSSMPRGIPSLSYWCCHANTTMAVLFATCLAPLALQVVPWARDHLDWQMVGTPLTHQHFRRRHMGAYGPKVMTNQPTASSLVSEGDQGTTSAPQAVQPMRGMYCCGDCTFPWIGTPAVAASGMWVANTLAPVWKHWAAANAVDH